MQREHRQERSQAFEGFDDTGLDMQKLLIPVYRIRPADGTARKSYRETQAEKLIRNDLEKLNQYIELILDRARGIIDDTADIRALIENLETILDYIREQTDE